MRRGRQDQHSTVMEVCEGGRCDTGAAEHGEGNALFPRDCCWSNVLHMFPFNVLWLQVYCMSVALGFKTEAEYKI